MSFREEIERVAKHGTSLNADWFVTLLNDVDALERDALRYRTLNLVIQNNGMACGDCSLDNYCDGHPNEVCFGESIALIQEEQLDKIVVYYKEKGIL